MNETSILVPAASKSILADSSAFDSKITETSKENLFTGAGTTDADMPQIETRVVLVEDAGKDEALINALEIVKIMEVPVIKIKENCTEKSRDSFIKSIVNMEIKVPCIKTDAVQEYADSDSPEFETVFVLSDFQNPSFQYLYKADCRVLGPPIIFYCARKGEPMPFTSRPLYCASMLNLVLCFTGFRRKEELVKLVTLVHHMGGTIRKDFSSKVTHLIANSTHGDKFRVAVSLGTPIMKSDWIIKAWEKRNELEFSATDEEFKNAFKVPPFQDCILSFIGFSDEERTSMEELTEMQGGQVQPVGNEKCTHLVVEENSVKELPFEPPKKLYVVKQEWFWGSIQMDARAGETMYLYEKADSPALKKSVSLLSLNTPNSNRKKRRLKDTLAHITRDTDVSPFPPSKRPSGDHSLSMGSLLDISNTPESAKPFPDKSKFIPPVQNQSARWQVAMELYQTESNYVDILTTIVQLFQIPLEKEGQVGGPILAQEEIKTIFGCIPDILDVHTKIKSDLEKLIVEWAETKSIGDVILTYSKDLVKTYPPFVNFFEMSKETIIQCEKQKPRFHAFLKINQAKPECGRQTLVELLIRPVQRLPSVALLLNDLKKHTSDDNPDKVMLEKAIDSLKEVMTHINEDKRKTEGQRQIFEVVYEVDGCPANLLSSHRMLVQRVETISLGDELCDRGEQVTLFLFNDCLEIARKRHKIKKVLDIRETEDCHNAFALVVRPPTEQGNQLFSFQLTTEEPPKVDWLKMLCRHVANTICKADAENLIYTTDPDSIEVSTRDVDSTLSRASRAIKKTSKKVTRAFSFSKTPKRALQRALMIHNTPDGRSPGSSMDGFASSRMSSTSSLAITRCSSAININGPAKPSNVQRSNSLDGSLHSPRSRVIACPGSPSSPVQPSLKGKADNSSPPLVPCRGLLNKAQTVPHITVNCEQQREQGNDYSCNKKSLQKEPLL
uniref:Epithelial cell transforming 2 n=1 Tax=Leptobrachium leishanense TaxID=445787 RepID=A0A8C5QNU2_9ANUR